MIFEFLLKKVVLLPKMYEPLRQFFIFLNQLLDTSLRLLLFNRQTLNSFFVFAMKLCNFCVLFPFNEIPDQRCLFKIDIKTILFNSYFIIFKLFFLSCQLSLDLLDLTLKLLFPLRHGIF